MSAQHDDKRPLNLEAAQELLPWYLTGKLSRAESESLERMLKGSADLREQLDSVRAQRRAVVDSSDALGGPTSGNLSKLLQQIETTKQRRYVAETNPENRVRWWFTSRPVLQFALIAACALVVAQAALLYHLGALPFLSSGNSYNTAGDATALPIPAASLIVSFRPDVTAAQLTQMLGEINATVIDGPKPGLTFVLGLADDASADAAIAKLQSRPDLVASTQRR
jgi:hypothetical protein